MLLISLSALAFAGIPIDVAELQESPAPLANGAVVISPFRYSSFGVNDKVTLSSNLLANIFALNLRARVAVLESDGTIVSVLPEASFSPWPGLMTRTAGVGVGISQEVSKGSVEASVTGLYATGKDLTQLDNSEALSDLQSGNYTPPTYSGVSVPVDVAYAMPRKREDRLWTFSASNEDVVSAPTDWDLVAAHTWGGEKLRFTLGGGYALPDNGLKFDARLWWAL